jgi:hypothetical protein
MSKSNNSYNKDDVSRAARKWCGIEGALKPFLDGQDLLSWISQQEKINPNNEINTDRILRTIAGNEAILKLFNRWTKQEISTAIMPDEG